MSVLPYLLSLALTHASPALPPRAVVSAAAPQVDESTVVPAPAEDRAAILTMAGAFRVTFQFEETVACTPGYHLADAYHEQATELVEVIADTGNRIELQHLLVVESGFVVKHWRQVWTYEDASVLDYRGLNTWEHREVPAPARRGTWTQAVFQTTDAPRYEATGRWTHLDGQSTWESEVTWRPLPRRERERTDYHVIQCRNRHTITPDGWVHEQDNQKVALDDAGSPIRVVAHEAGLNRYDRVESDVVAPAIEYWEFYAEAWKDVRAAWQPILAQQRFTLCWRSNGERMDGLVDYAIDLDDELARRDVLSRLMQFVVHETH